jgi:adenylate cyclase
VLPVLSYVMHRQLLDEVDNRVDDAKAGFQTELNDDLLDQELTLRVMAADDDVERALATRDVKTAHELASVFASVYPEMDIVLADVDGRVLTQLGVTAPPERIDSIAELAGLIKGHDFRGVLEHGCEKPGSDAPPAYVMARALANAGSIVVCQPFNVAYMEDAKGKLGLELALLARGEPNKLLLSTSHFPAAAVPTITHGSVLDDEGGTTWALSRVEPKGMGDYGVAAALDVTSIRSIVTRNLLSALAALLVGAVIFISVGSRLANTMSRAIRRLNDAQKKLEQQQYVHVDAVKTGDELEDLAVTFNAMVDNLKAYDNMKTTMGKYMARKVMAHLLEKDVELGGETLMTTILFTDIRSFTTISEKMDAQQLVGLLNEYFNEMVSVVIEEDGVVDKYIGDAIMVVFGAPTPAPDDAVRAVRAAVGMRKALSKLNERLKARGFEPLRTGIGIHSGEVVAGSIGHEQMRGYTVIGDAVNLASRLETATKELGVAVLISEDTYKLTKEAIDARPVKEIHVKGRVQAVMTYEVIGLKGGPARESVTRTSAPPAAAKPAAS